MKTFSKLTILTLALCGAWACNDDKNHGVIPEPITYARVAGTWQLTEWNGDKMNDGRYCYMVLDRKECTFDIYQNLDSSKSRHLTGTYSLVDDDDLGTVIKGMYDHASGFWNNSYVISKFSADSMTWIVTDDESDVSVYTRCASVPENILTRTEER